MNVWQKITVGCKFLFGGFESAVDYVLGLLNKWVMDKGYADKIAVVAKKAMSVLTWLQAHQDYCPPKWSTDYRRLIVAATTIVTAADDGQLTADEIGGIVNCWKLAYTDWQKED